MSEALAWAAGLFDGEGSVYLRQRGQYPRAGAMLTLEMTDRPTVERFAAVVPGGQLYGSRVIAQRTTLPLWRWRASRLETVVCSGHGPPPLLGDEARRHAARYRLLPQRTTLQISIKGSDCP